MRRDQEYQVGHIRLVLHQVQLDQQYRERLLYQHHQVYQQGHVDQDNLVFQYVVLALDVVKRYQLHNWLYCISV